MPSRAMFRTMNAAHRTLLRVSRGRIGSTGMGMPVIELTTIGRRSGQPRTVLLTAPIHEDGTYVVVGSRGGDDAHPHWFLNLRDRPAVEVSVGGERRPMAARIPEGDDRARLWDRIADAYPHYVGYQRKTDRELPLVVLEPA